MLCKISCEIRWIEDGAAERVFIENILEAEGKFRFYMIYLASNDNVKDISIHLNRL